MARSATKRQATKFNGLRQLVDTKTGETIEVQDITKSVDSDIGFHKVWLHNILEIVEETGNAKMRCLMWLLSKADGMNQIHANWTEIAKGANVSPATVKRLMAALDSANIITMIRRGKYRINPEVVFKGSHHRRMAVLIRYRDESQPDLFDAEEPADACNVRSIDRRVA